MKFSVENKKKQIAYIATIVICAGLIAWIWLPQVTQKNSIDAPLATPALNVAGGLGGAAALLPFGESFDTGVFKDSRFQKLVAPKILQVAPEELGRRNPFLPVGFDEYIFSTSTPSTTPAAP